MLSYAHFRAPFVDRYCKQSFVGKTWIITSCHLLFLVAGCDYSRPGWRYNQNSGMYPPLRAARTSLPADPVCSLPCKFCLTERIFPNSFPSFLHDFNGSSCAQVLHPDLEIADYAFPPLRSTLSPVKMLVSGLLEWEYDMFLLTCSSKCFRKVEVTLCCR